MYKLFMHPNALNNIHCPRYVLGYAKVYATILGSGESNVFWLEK